MPRTERATTSSSFLCEKDGDHSGAGGSALWLDAVLLTEGRWMIGLLLYTARQIQSDLAFMLDLFGVDRWQREDGTVGCLLVPAFA